MSKNPSSTLSAKDESKQAPLRPTKFGTFVAGTIVGACFASLTTFVVSVSGPAAGIPLIIGIALVLGAIGVHLGDNQ
jgi:hypothetical protein